MSDDPSVPRWVRLGAVVLLGVPQLAIGLWAVVSPSGWYQDFPGTDPRLVAAEPPYNQHLVTDSGAGFLAVGVGLLAAAVLAHRSGLLVALAVTLTHSVVHLVWHVGNPSALLTRAEDTLNVIALLSVPVIAVVLGAGLLRRAPATLGAAGG